MPLTSGASFGRYEIVRLLGAGGMGEVYLARDERLEREVAVKVLPAGALADEAARRRFRKEALALSKLNHPNIETIYDFDSREGVDFLVMEYVPGQTLAQRLAGGALPEREVATLGAQIASALEEAHELGVVHRDLKPDNIRVTPKSQVKVLDFGLAKLLRPVGEGSQAETASQTLEAVGTLPYMAPEQLRAESVDARSDIFALGAVLYEMATQQRTFRGHAPARLIDAVLHEDPVSPRALNPTISPEVERVILKCLDKDPARRYQSARELRVDLERVTAPHSLRTAAVPPQTPSRRRVTSGRRIRAIAVLPLENLSRDPEQEYFADGMTEALITVLAQLGAVRVISRTSAMQYKGARKPLPVIAQELNVDAIVEGTVLRVGERVRITAQLIEAATDAHLWAQNYENDLRDVLTLQSEVASAIAHEVHIKLTPQQGARLARPRKVLPEAHEAYLKGRYYWNKRTEEGLEKGIESFKQAVERDPDYAAAHAGLADCYNVLGFYAALPPKETFPQAEAAAVRALELDDNLAEAHTSLAYVKDVYHWDAQGAESEYKRAISLNPNYATAHHWYAEYLTVRGRGEEGLAEMRRAQELDPLSLVINAGVVCVLYYCRKYDMAIEQSRRAFELDPNFVSTHLFLGQAYVQKGMFEKAISELRKGVALSGAFTEVRMALGHAYAVAGRRGEAQKVLNELQQLSMKRYVSPYLVAAIYMGLRDRNLAFQWLEKALEDRSSLLVWLKMDPMFDSLRSDPRFGDLLRRIRLPLD